MSQQSQFDASGQAAGYLHQIRYALLLAIQHDESTDILSLEVIDDVSFGPSDGTHAEPSEVFQLKHSITRVANLSDKSVDLWKTLRVWAEQIHSKQIDPEKTIFTLITTSQASANSALVNLRRDDRNPEKARNLLEKAGEESKNSTVTTALASLNKLKVSERKLLFGNIFLIDGSANILETRKLIERELRYSVEEPTTQLSGFADRLEGWWFRAAVEHLAQTSNPGISVEQVQSQIRDLIDQFKRDNLPDDLLDAIVPADELLSDDDRTFVSELRRITNSRHVIRIAQDNHYRAFEQRSRWLRETLLEISEDHAYEARLLKEWAQKVSIAVDGSDGLSDDERIALGKQLYEWVQDSAGSSSAFHIRRDFQSPYLARGSFHMLVDKSRMVWHPDDVDQFLDAILEGAKNA